jgi:two-component system cell cycle sensor histidine kinase/response regulator CckA
VDLARVEAHTLAEVRERLHASEERSRQAEEALRQSHEKFAKAFQSSPDTLVMSRLTDGRIVEVNEVFVGLTGFSREEALGRTTIDLDLWVDPQDRQRYLEDLRSGAGVRDQPARFRKKVGTVIDGLVSGEIIPLGDELVALTTIRDITDRKLAEEERSTLEAQLRQSQKMEAVGRLAGGVAHDFNNMLGVILGYADIALRKLSPIDPLWRTLAAIRDAAQRSADLTQQLLAFSRQQVIAPRVIDLNDRLKGMERLLQRVIGEDVALEFVFAADAWPVSMDPSQVDQIVANLAVNSRDAMPDGGKLVVETANVTLDAAYCRRHAGARPGEHLMLAVSDTGSGMDERTRERAFEPFFTTKAEGKGTGLGLATVYGVVKQNEGFIDIQSELGHGTTITLYLPRAEPDAMAPPEAASSVVPARGHETVLLVEDQAQLREIAHEMLEDLGYTVLVAPSPGDALTLCEKHPGPIHLLFTDVVMPNMNGKELAGRVQAMKPGIRTLFTSGYTADTIAHRGVLDARISFLEKPYSMESLARKVREVLAA